LLLLPLRAAGRENPELLRAMHALCHGMGGSEGVCGLLTGGVCLLGCIAGRGKDDEQALPLLAPLADEYRQWFEERAARYGGPVCSQIMQGLSTETGVARPAAGEIPSPTLCGDFFAECWEKLHELLESYDLSMELR
jgi:hypothetical protein